MTPPVSSLKTKKNIKHAILVKQAPFTFLMKNVKEGNERFFLKTNRQSRNPSCDMGITGLLLLKCIKVSKFWCLKPISMFSMPQKVKSCTSKRFSKDKHSNIEHWKYLLIATKWGTISVLYADELNTLVWFSFLLIQLCRKMENELCSNLNFWPQYHEIRSRKQ